MGVARLPRREIRNSCLIYHSGEIRFPHKIFSTLGDDVDAGAVGDKTFELREVERNGFAVIRVAERVMERFQECDEIGERIVVFGVDVRRHFQDEHWPEAAQCFTGALEHRKFVSVHVDFNEVEAGKDVARNERIEGVDACLGSRNETAAMLRMHTRGASQRPTGVDFRVAAIRG